MNNSGVRKTKNVPDHPSRRVSMFLPLELEQRRHAWMLHWDVDTGYVHSPWGEAPPTVAASLKARHLKKGEKIIKIKLGHRNALKFRDKHKSHV